MLRGYKTSAADWKPSPVLALATSVDGTQIAAAREDATLEIWVVSPGSISWHCQLTVHGDSKSRVSSLVWCRGSSERLRMGRLLSSSIDGSVYEWDLFELKQKAVMDSVGVSIWQMAVAPEVQPLNGIGNGLANGIRNHSSSDSDDGDELLGHQDESFDDVSVVALACDDGCVRLYNVTESDKLVYKKSLPRVSGRTLSVAWSSDGNLIYSGSSDGFIRCWNVASSQEIYRINVGHGSDGSGSDICIWSLIALSNGSVVSADSSGSVQFWDARHGTLLQTHSLHKGDVMALAAVPSHDKVFSAGSDGQIILFKHSKKDDSYRSSGYVKWNYVHSVRTHTNDVNALTVAMPITRNGILMQTCSSNSSFENSQKRLRCKLKPVDNSYHKWAEKGVPMLISAGDDTKLFAYPANDFTKFSPHDICPAPQRLPIQLAPETIFNKMPLVLSQSSHHLDIFRACKTNVPISELSSGPPWSAASLNILAQVKCKSSQKIICSTISCSGEFIAYSNNQRVILLELVSEARKNAWTIQRKKLPKSLPFAHSMIFTADSSRLIICGCDRKIYVIDIEMSELIHVFTPRHEETADNLPPSEPPITKLFVSLNGAWLAAVNCFGDIYLFNLDDLSQHWFISRLCGASITSGGFLPTNCKLLVVTTSSNQVYTVNVESKQLHEQLMLPRGFQEYPGEVIGLSFLSSSSTAVVYSARTMCLIEFGNSAARGDNLELVNESDSALRKLQQASIFGKLKRTWKELELEYLKFYPLSNPVLFIGHFSDSSMLVIDKPWIDVVKTFEAAPVHRHIYGS